MLQSAHWRLCLEPSGADPLPPNGAAKRRWASCWVLRLFLWRNWIVRAAAAAVICGRCCWICIGITGVPNLELGLETLVQANGRSLKPDQLRQLLAQRLGCELQQTQLRRVALKLAC